MNTIQQDLFAMADEEYRRFQSRLIPSVPFETVIGVRLPALRAYAKRMSEADAAVFMKKLPHTYYEENNLHAFLIARITDYDTCVAEAERFLPYVDNWATCDSLRPKVFAKHKEQILAKAGEWMTASHPFTVRFGLEMRMLHGLDEMFSPRFLDDALAVDTQEYYVHMMVAWFFATALTKQYDAALPYIQQCRLDIKTHNKAIQKARESLLISPDQKAYLNTLKR